MSPPRDPRISNFMWLVSMGIPLLACIAAPFMFTAGFAGLLGLVLIAMLAQSTSLLWVFIHRQTSWQSDRKTMNALLAGNALLVMLYPTGLLITIWAIIQSMEGINT